MSKRRRKANKKNIEKLRIYLAEVAINPELENGTTIFPPLKNKKKRYD